MILLKYGVFALLLVMFTVIIHLGKLTTLIWLILGTVYMLYGLYKQFIKKTKKKRKRLLDQSYYVMAGVFYVISILGLTRLTTAKSFPFLWETIISTVLVTIGVIIITIRHKMALKNKIAIGFFTMMMSFFATFLILGVVNYSLDQSKPTYETYEVIDKKISAGARKITSYDLIILKDGKKMYIDVGRSSYHLAVIGDEIILEIYKGFLGESYYQYGGIKDIQ